MDVNKINQWADEIIERAQSIKAEVANDTDDGVIVTTGAELQAALNEGGSIYLAEGGDFRGNFIVSHPSTYLYGTKLGEGRVGPDEITAVLRPGDMSLPVLKILASDVIISGVMLQQGAADKTVVIVGSSTEPDPGKLPDLVTLDQVDIHTGGTGKRGIECNSRSFALLRSRIVGFLFQGADSQAFWGNNGPGPFLIEDNEISASGENIMFGGDRIRSEANHPSNATIRGNLIIKPQDWRSKSGSVKNSLEFKAMKGALVEENIFDGCWKDSQPGNMIVLTPRNQYGDNPFVQVCDIAILNNKTIRHTDGRAINILYTDDINPSKETVRISIEHNLFQDSPSGMQILGGVGEYLKYLNNTLPATKHSCINFDSKRIMTPLTYTKNVIRSGDYGAHSSNYTVGKATLEGYCAPLNFTENVIEKTAARSITWPSGNTLLAPNTLAASLDENFKYVPDPSVGY